MGTMLPPELVDKVRKACQASGVDEDTTLNVIHQTVGGRTIVNHHAWVGPGPQEADMLLDIHILCERFLFNYEVHKNNVSAESITFLYDVGSTTFAVVDDPRTDLIIVVERGEEGSRIFGKTADHERMRQFHMDLLAGCLRAKATGEGQT